MPGWYIRRDGTYIGMVHTSRWYIRRDGTIIKTVLYLRQDGTYVGAEHDLSVLYRHCFRPDQRDRGAKSWRFLCGPF